MPAKNDKKPATVKKPTKAKKTSALDAAVQVVAESGGAMAIQEMIETMAAKKLWKSPAGKTPAATLYSAILREIHTKGKDSRFQKTEPGKFAATGATGKAKTTAAEEKPATTPKATKPKGTKGKGKKSAEPAAPAAAIPDGTPGPESMQELFRI